MAKRPEFSRILTVKSISEVRMEAKKEDKTERYKVVLHAENPDYKIKMEISSNDYRVLAKIFENAGINDIMISLPVEVCIRRPAKSLADYGGDKQ